MLTKVKVKKRKCFGALWKISSAHDHDESEAQAEAIVKRNMGEFTWAKSSSQEDDRVDPRLKNIIGLCYQQELACNLVVLHDWFGLMFNGYWSSDRV
ncbi:hypothetical protein YC2023_063266 [Brassica napus]